MKTVYTFLSIFSLTLIILLVPFAGFTQTDSLEISSDSQVCLSCHEGETPGIVGDWRNSNHAANSKSIIGCAECHTINPESHGDTFKHMGYEVHVVVTPNDCATCHPTEREQYADNIMANAYGNLMNNPVYLDLANNINMIDPRADAESVDLTFQDSCLSCHGTKVYSAGLIELETSMGPLLFPDLKGWPNQGVGRINPDGTFHFFLAPGSYQLTLSDGQITKPPVAVTVGAKRVEQTYRF